MQSLHQRSRRRNDIVPRAQRLPLALAAACLFTLAGPAAQAQGVVLPVGPNVVRGSAGINTGSNLMTVRNSNGTIIDWRGFSIGSGGTVRFDQANASSQVLNRVVGNDPSRILGSLQSNGKVWLLNPHGVLFGKSARVDVTGLVASTLSIGNDDWAAGRQTLTNTLAGDRSSVVNEGQLSALGGRIALVAGNGGVANSGVIEARAGQVVLAAGTSVDLVDTGAPNITLRIGSVSNLGSVFAPGGRIDAQAAIVNQQGLMRADALTSGAGGEILLRASVIAASGASITSARGEQGGRVIVDAGREGTVLARGDISATGSAGRGGTVQLLGRGVGVFEGAALDASGSSGGGEVQVGSSGTLVALTQSGATLAADARGSGDGGRVAVRSDGTTLVAGRLSARGAGPGGSGGRIETSGVVLDARSLTADASAADGNAGQWRAQAGHVAIADGSSVSFNTAAVAAVALPPFTPVVTPRSIEAALNNGTNVEVVASGAGSAARTGDITMTDARLFVLPRNDVNLSLQAARDVEVRDSSVVNSDGAALSLSLRAGRNVSLTDSTLRTWSDRTSVGVEADSLMLDASAIDSDGRIRIAADSLRFDRRFGEGDMEDRSARITSAAAGDAIVVSGRRSDGVTSFVNNADPNVLDASNGRWLFYAANPAVNRDPDSCDCTSFALSELPYAFSRHGASFARRNVVGGNVVTPLPGNGLLYAAAPNTVTFDGSTSKIYDGNDAGTIARDAIRVSGGLQPGERAVLGDGSVAGTYDSRNTDARTFTPRAGAVGFIDAQGRPVFGYDNNLGPLQGRITPAPLTLLGAGAADKNYDATPLARITSVSLGGLVGDEQLGFVASGAFDDANAGTGKTVRGSVGALSDGANGGLARNYTLRGVSFTTSASILPAWVTVNATAADKTYDATPAATITSFSINGLVGSEQLGLVASGAFDDANAGVGKTVRGSVSGLSNGANGGLASNYTLRDPGFTTTATISPALLSVVGASAADKRYDATTAAQITSVSFAGLVGSEQVGFVAGGAFDDANAGVGKTVRGNVSGLADGANGGRAGNYTVSGAGFTTNATISPAPVTVIATAADKTYDATPTATITSFSINGLVGSERLGLAASGAFDDANAGVGKTVRGSVAGLSNGANGGLSSNYTLRDANFTTTATISPAELTVLAATAADKTYDTTAAAQITSVSLRGLVGSEQLGVAATGAFADANADTGKTVRGNVTALSNGANGGLANNYSLRDGAFTTIATIAPATLTYRADSTTWNLPTITPLSGSVSGLLGEDTLAGATTGTLSFTAPTAAATEPGTFAVQGGGLAARNYVFVQHDANAGALSVNRRIVDSIVVERVAPFVGNELFPQPPALLLPIVPGSVPGRITDISQWLGTTAFNSLPLAGMSPSMLSSMLSSRERYKARVFAEAIDRLESEPALADSPDCKTAQQVETGDCLITESLRREMAGRSTVGLIEAAPTAPATAADATAPAAPAADADAASEPADEPAATFAARRRVKSATLPQIERKVALLIGIDEHADARIPKLANAANDARTVGELLDTELGYETVVLANASKQQIVRTLNQLALTLGPKDSVVIYYAGHGQIVPANGLGYWQPADADATKPETWLSNADIGKLVSRLGASQVALVSDSCFSGQLVSEERIRPVAASTDPAALLKRRAAVVMSSGGNEPVFDEGKNGHSLFAFGLMQALQQVPTWQAGGNVFERVRFAVAKELPQRPRYGAALTGGHEAGADYVFEKRELE